MKKIYLLLSLKDKIHFFLIGLKRFSVFLSKLLQSIFTLLFLTNGKIKYNTGGTMIIDVSNNIDLLSKLIILSIINLGLFLASDNVFETNCKINPKNRKLMDANKVITTIIDNQPLK